MRDPLFESYALNDELTVNNRIVMAPLTRCFAAPGLVPTAQMAAYYARRASVGLIISEATIIRPDGQGYPNTPGIYSDEQLAGWRLVTDAVHQAGGKIFAQLWHVGRVSHSVFHGMQPVAPSAIGLQGTLPRMRELSYPEPRALTTDEVTQLVTDYAQAADNAIAAGFDGVEIHGANGYLIDQFLHPASNQRHDQYGGSVENYCRFALEVVDAVTACIGGKRTALRLSPGAYVHMDSSPLDRAIFDHLLDALNQRELAFIHLGIFDDNLTFDYLDGRASDYLRRHYRGNLVTVGGYTPELSREALRTKRSDLIAIGRPLIANPDYVQRVLDGKELRPYGEEMLSSLD